jgi:hypothetical protein
VNCPPVGDSTQEEGTQNFFKFKAIYVNRFWDIILVVSNLSYLALG